MNHKQSPISVGGHASTQPPGVRRPMTMHSPGQWEAACSDPSCVCTVPQGTPCDDGFSVPEREHPGLIPLCGECGWPEVSHVPAAARHRLRPMARRGRGPRRTA